MTKHLRLVNERPQMCTYRLLPSVNLWSFLHIIQDSTIIWNEADVVSTCEYAQLDYREFLFVYLC